MITTDGVEHDDKVSGACAFLDGKGLDGSPGTEALRLCSDGQFLVRGVPETDPALIIRALRDWTTRVLDASKAPTSDMTNALTGPIDPAVGRVAISSYDSRASIVMEPDGGIYVNGGLVEHDDKLRQNLRRVLERMRVGK